MGTPYETDVVVWGSEQARLIRARRFDLLDVEHIADELEDAGKNEQRELSSRLPMCHGGPTCGQMRSRRRRVKPAPAPFPRCAHGRRPRPWARAGCRPGSEVSGMARPLGIELAGGIYHMTARGDRREPI